MSSAVGITLTATSISFVNEWYDTNEPNFRILIAGGLVSLLFDGISQLSEEAGTGLAVLMFISVMVTPFNGKSPVEQLAGLAVANPRKKLTKGRK